MKFLQFVLFFSALAIAPLSPAGSQSVEAVTSPAMSHHVLLAQAQPAPPRWGFGRLMPQGTVLPRDRERSPAVIGFYFRMTPPDDWVVTWTDNVQASAQRLMQETATRTRGERLLFFKIDPCAVTGLDTPGTEIPITYEFVFSASQPQGKWTPPVEKGSLILKLDRDTVPPAISFLHAPTTVYRDETVQIDVSATDVSEEMGGNLVWDSGLHVFRLEGPANPNQGGLQTHVVDDSVPTTCGDKVKTADHSFSYTVPHSAQPGQEIKLRVEVEDWSGNKTGRDVVLKVAERCRGDARWVGSVSGIHRIDGHRIKLSAESVRLCEGPLQPVGYLIKGHVHTITLGNDGSTITSVHDEAGDTVCRITGQTTSSMMGYVGEITSTLEEIGRNGELRWSQPTYWLSVAPAGGSSYTETCHYGTGTQTNTYTGAGWGVPNIGHDTYDPQTGNRKLEGGRMAGSYATPDGITATWNLTRQGGAPLFPARGNAR